MISPPSPSKEPKPASKHNYAQTFDTGHYQNSPLAFQVATLFLHQHPEEIKTKELKYFHADRDEGYYHSPLAFQAAKFLGKGCILVSKGTQQKRTPGNTRRPCHVQPKRKGSQIRGSDACRMLSGTLTKNGALRGVTLLC